MNTEVQKTKLYDLAKCFTAILVVIAHVTRMYSPLGAISVAGQSPFLSHFTSYIYAFHMPLFIMLSGCVYGYCIENGKYGKALPFLKNKARKLLIPYFAFGVLYVAPVMLALGLAKGYAGYVLRGIILSNNSRHLWYLPALFWIFALFILLKPLLTKGKGHLAAVGCVSLLLTLASGFMPGSFQIPSACHYQFFFFLGILFNRFYDGIVRSFRRFRAVGFALPFAMLTMFGFASNSAADGIYAVMGILMAMFLFWGTLCRFPNVIGNRVYLSLKKNSFGIYLFHPMIVYALFYWLGKYNINPFLLSALICAAAILASIGATALLRKLRLKVLIGE